MTPLRIDSDEAVAPLWAMLLSKGTVHAEAS